MSRTPQYPFRALALATCLVATGTGLDSLVRSAHLHSARDPMGLPNQMLWAWERPEDIRFIDPRNTGVAFLAATIYLLPSRATQAGDEGVLLRPRMQPLRVSPGTPLVAVVRIETSRRLAGNVSGMGEAGGAPKEGIFSRLQLERVVARLADVAERPHITALQIDFDAIRSERTFYLALLQAARSRLPHTPISITALASWCKGDLWLAELPAGTIDEAVPMLFRMGPDTQSISAFVEKGGDFPLAACRGSLGLSTDEPLSDAVLSGATRGGPGVAMGKRIYLFRPGSWNAASLKAAVNGSTR
jgi:hypothetical protein